MKRFVMHMLYLHPRNDVSVFLYVIQNFMQHFCCFNLVSDVRTVRTVQYGNVRLAVTVKVALQYQYNCTVQRV